MADPTGPFETELQVINLPAVQAIYKAFDADPKQGSMTPQNRRLLEQACEASGVELGAWDQRIVEGLSHWETTLCAVVARWITDAHEAGKDEGRKVTTEEGH